MNAGLIKNMNLKTRMLAAFAFMGLIIFLVALIGVSGNARMSHNIDAIANDAFPSTVALWKINEGQTQVQASDRSLLNPGISFEIRQREKIRLENAWKQINQGFNEYEKMQHTPEEEQLYEAFKPLWDRWKATYEQYHLLNQEFEKYNLSNPLQIQVNLLNQGKANDPQIVIARAAQSALNKMSDYMYGTKTPALAASAAALQKVLDYNNRKTIAAKNAAAGDIGQNRVWVLVGLLIGPLTAVLFGVYFSNAIAKPLGAKIAEVVDVAQKMSGGDLTAEIKVTDQKDELSKLMTSFRSMNRGLGTLIKQVQKSSLQVTTSATQIAASGKQLEATVNEQVASTNEVVATARAISTTAGQLVKTIGEVSNMSKASAIAASTGQKDLTRMEKTMRHLADATISISGKLGIISEKANNINSVVTTITKVADQTNLLSLNAAIEAEKAGEYGMGFAVVAREIRRLADQTAIATLDIESMVKEMQSAVSTGVMEMDKFTKEVSQGVDDIQTISLQLAEIIEQVQSVTPRFEAVDRGMEAQAEGAQQISEAMGQLSETSMQTADALREINSAIAQLNEVAQSLSQEISRFKIN